MNSVCGILTLWYTGIVEACAMARARSVGADIDTRGTVGALELRCAVARERERVFIVDEQ